MGEHPRCPFKGLEKENHFIRSISVSVVHWMVPSPSCCGFDVSGEEGQVRSLDPVPVPAGFGGVEVRHDGILLQHEGLKGLQGELCRSNLDRGLERMTRCSGATVCIVHTI